MDKDNPVSQRSSPPAVDNMITAFEALLNEIATQKDEPPPQLPPPPPPTPAQPIPIRRPRTLSSPPDGNNPFYHPDFTLALAGNQIHSVIQNALRKLREFMTRAEYLIAELVQKRGPETPLRKISTELKQVLQLLEYGRKGWNLAFLPHQFFEDVLGIMDETCENVEKLMIHHEEGRWLGEGMGDVLEAIRGRLETIWEQRRKIEREEKRKFKLAQNEQAQSEMQNGDDVDEDSSGKSSAKNEDNAAKKADSVVEK